MDDRAPDCSTLEDLQGVGSLFLRRQCSIGVLRIHFDRAATRSRLLAPDATSDLRGYTARLDDIARRPAREQYVAVAVMLDEIDRRIREPVRPATPVPELVPVEPPPGIPDDLLDAPVRMP